MRGWGHPSAIVLVLFGGCTTWCKQARVLGELKEEGSGSVEERNEVGDRGGSQHEEWNEFNDDRAIEFKKSAHGECTVVAAAAIASQIAIAGLLLDNINHTHWTARALFFLSLTFALIAVLYSNLQQRILGRLLTPQDIRQWIRGPGKSCNPHNYVKPSRIQDFGSDIERSCFTPSITSVIIISTPRVLISSSLGLLFIALGIYLGHLSLLNLDPDAKPNNTGIIFLLYVIGLAVYGSGYIASQFFNDDENFSESDIVHGYLKKWTASGSGRNQLAAWEIEPIFVGNRVQFRSMTDNEEQDDRGSTNSNRQIISRSGGSEHLTGDHMHLPPLPPSNGSSRQSTAPTVPSSSSSSLRQQGNIAANRSTDNINAASMTQGQGVPSFPQTQSEAVPVLTQLQKQQRRTSIA
ncbi:hypothetical protein NHQ30_009544 [Ciborinia camelliae]|nr:hypothetical protein NHQ30_009544 [Ciborinia camelliae]